MENSSNSLELFPHFLAEVTFVYLVDVCLEDFPKNVTLTHGEDESRVWWEWREGKRGVVIQKNKLEDVFYVFFFEGKSVRLLKVRDDSPAAFRTINEAVEALRELGFDVKLKKPYEVVKDNVVRVFDDEFLLELFRCSEIPPIASDDRTTVTFPVKLTKKELKELLKKAREQYLSQ